jgi:hypothetical protein
MPVSRDTLLGLLRALPEPAIGEIAVLGVDDFALRRGHVYTAILLDMATHRPVDVLPGRDSEPLAGWLRAPPRREGDLPGPGRRLRRRRPRRRTRRGADRGPLAPVPQPRRSGRQDRLRAPPRLHPSPYRVHCRHAWRSIINAEPVSTEPVSTGPAVSATAGPAPGPGGEPDVCGANVPW